MKYIIKIAKPVQAVVGQPIMALADVEDILPGCKGVIVSKDRSTITVKWNHGRINKLSQKQLPLFGFVAANLTNN